MTSLSLFPQPRTCRACGATDTGNQTTVPTCRYELQAHLEPHQRDHVNRPPTCLNAHDPDTSDIPY